MEYQGSEYGIFIVCHTTTRSTQAKREWNKFYWAELADWLTVEYGAKVIFTGDENYNNDILALMKGSAEVWSGSLNMLKELLLGASLVVSVNTFPMHLAVALKRPLVAIVGATDPSVILPEHIERCYSEYAWEIPLQDVEDKVRKVLNDSAQV